MTAVCASCGNPRRCHRCRACDAWVCSLCAAAWDEDGATCQECAEAAAALNGDDCEEDDDER